MTTKWQHIYELIFLVFIIPCVPGENGMIIINVLEEK
jgi:hypothetical protein